MVLAVESSVDSVTKAIEGCRQRRVPSLDGLRAVSICMVLFGHLTGTHGFPISTGASKWLGDLAHLGVLVFFVISGFLITSLLIEEYDRRGSISLRRFYERRALRIFPALYVLLLVMLLGTAFGFFDLKLKDFVFAAGYLVNYYPNPPWAIGHLWSLAIEEQFYLLWPLLLLAMGKRRGLMLALAAIMLAPITRALILQYTFHINPRSALRDLPIFPAMFDYIATGCALAILRPWLTTQAWYLRMTGIRSMFVLVPLVLLINRFDGYTIVDVVGSPVMNIAIAVMVDMCIRHVDSPLGRFLNTRPVIALGVLSYSLYLWQQLFINRNGTSWDNAFPQNLVFAFGAAMLSYLVVERAFLRLRERMRRNPSVTQ